MTATRQQRYPDYTIERIQVGTAYAANGNLHNPTKYYRYNVLLDGKVIDNFKRKRDAWEWIAELQANAKRLREGSR